MHSSDYRSRVRECSSCGRIVRLNREGRYRRHFVTEPDGRVHLCAGSGQESAMRPSGVAARAQVPVRDRA